jgi:hypothetical protein
LIPVASALPELVSTNTTDFVNPLETVPKSCVVAVLALTESDKFAFSFFLPHEITPIDNAADDTNVTHDSLLIRIMKWTSLFWTDEEISAHIILGLKEPRQFSPKIFGHLGSVCEKVFCDAPSI